jgi:hypothetical protein
MNTTLEAILINMTGQDLIMNSSDKELTEDASHGDLVRRGSVSIIRYLLCNVDHKHSTFNE